MLVRTDDTTPPIARPDQRTGHALLDASGTTPSAALPHGPSVLLSLGEDHDLLERGSVTLLALYDQAPLGGDSELTFPMVGASGSSRREYREGTRWTYECWRRRDFDAAIAAADLLASSRGELTPTDLCVLERVRRAVPVFGSTWHNGWCHALLASRIPVLAGRAAETRAEQMVENATALLASGDVRGAALAAREATVRVVDALLAHAGRLRVAPHERESALRALCAAGHPARQLLGPDKLWTIERMSDYTDAGAASWVGSVLRTCLTTLVAMESIDVMPHLLAHAEGTR